MMDYVLKDLVEETKRFMEIAGEDGLVDDPDGGDEESIGWKGDQRMKMTYGDIRRIHIVLEIAEAFLEGYEFE